MFANKAVHIDPNNFHAWFNIGLLFKKSKQLDKASEKLQNAKKINPNYIMIYNELGSIYSSLGKYESAEKKFSEGLSIEKYPNLRHKVYLLVNQSENYRR